MPDDEIERLKAEIEDIESIADDVIDAMRLEIDRRIREVEFEAKGEVFDHEAPEVFHADDLRLRSRALPAHHAPGAETIAAGQPVEVIDSSDVIDEVVTEYLVTGGPDYGAGEAAEEMLRIRDQVPLGQPAEVTEGGDSA